MTKDKYDKINQIINKIDEIRKIWLKDMNDKDLTKAQFGLATEIIYNTAMRVGTEGNMTNGQPTYGLLTLRAKDVKCDNNKVVFDYIGKAGVRHKHIITDKKVVKLICILKKNRKSDEKLFKITPEQLNLYLKNRLKLPITIHKFRTLKGTKIAYKKLIEENPCSKLKTEKEKLDYLKKVLLEIGKELGHYSGEKITGETALKNYIDLSIIKQYFEKCNIKVNKKFQKLFSLIEHIDNIPDEYPAWPGIYDTAKAAKILTHYTKYF
jgi:DNA topoisomerase IB